MSYTPLRLSEEQFQALAKLIRIDAAEKRNNAGYAGSYGDDGAGALEEKLKYYEMGRTGEVPEAWKVYANKLDPEYDEYVRLKKKFGTK